jgi:hypothetical protein
MKSMTLEWARHAAQIGEKRCAYNVLVAKPEGQRPLGRSERRCDHYILSERDRMGGRGMDTSGS